LYRAWHKGGWQHRVVSPVGPCPGTLCSFIPFARFIHSFICLLAPPHTSARMADTDQPEAYPATVLLVYNKCGTHAERAVDSLATALEREGFRLYCVHEAREAVAAYSTMVPEVVSVLVDWDLKTNEKHDNSSNPSLAMPPSSSQHQQQQQRRTHVPKVSRE